MKHFNDLLVNFMARIINEEYPMHVYFILVGFFGILPWSCIVYLAIEDAVVTICGLKGREGE